LGKLKKNVKNVKKRDGKYVKNVFLHLCLKDFGTEVDLLPENLSCELRAPRRFVQPDSTGPTSPEIEGSVSMQKCALELKICDGDNGLAILLMR